MELLPPHHIYTFDFHPNIFPRILILVRTVVSYNGETNHPAEPRNRSQCRKPPLATSALDEQRRNASRTADAERSKPRHEVTIEKDVFVTMRDGTHIALDIYHPAEEGTYPPSTRSLRT